MIGKCISCMGRGENRNKMTLSHTVTLSQSSTTRNAVRATVQYNHKAFAYTSALFFLTLQVLTEPMTDGE